jgi:threonine dehydratase
LARQAPELQAVIVPIGGGGLCAGISSAIKQALPGCLIFGVEPEGADSMHRSFASGRPETIERVATIADSLGSPRAEPYSFELCRQNIDKLVMVNDDELRKAMYLFFRGMRLAVEPAGAAALAALSGPLRQELEGKKVGLIVSGTNIDPATFCRHLQAAVE